MAETIEKTSANSAYGLKKTVSTSIPVANAAAEAYRREYHIYEETLGRLAAARHQFMKEGIISPAVRPEIAESWQRCKAEGLQPDAHRLSYLPDPELKELLEQSDYLIRIASPVLRSVYESLTNASCLCATYLTDENGTVLECVTNEDLKYYTDKLGLKVGARWNEQTIGTNAISLALRTNSVYHTYAPEHYLDSHNFVNCVTAPIHNNDGKVIGAITVTFYMEFYNEFLIALISTAAGLIENQFLTLRYNGIINYTLQYSIEGVLILDSDFRVIQSNKKFYEMIGEPTLKPEELDVSMLFKGIDFSAVADGAGIEQEFNETFLSYQDIHARVNVRIHLMKTYGNVDGYILTCREISEIIHFSQNFISNSSTASQNQIITRNPQMLSLIDQGKRVADMMDPVLLQGESGTGKEVFALMIHHASKRAKKPFISVNCAALPISSVESELFGFEKGSLGDDSQTGRAGKFELASGGTIFLDEVDALPLDVQAKLLRVLETRSYSRIGGMTEKRLDLRVITASNSRLQDQVRAKNFREDLYYRLRKYTFNLPPLSRRAEDIPLLVHYFLTNLNMENRGINRQMDERCMEILKARNWTGNIRELQYVVTRSYYLSNSALITVAQLPKDFYEAEKEATVTPTKDEMEEALILQAIESAGGNISKAARNIGLSRATVYRKLKKYG